MYLALAGIFAVQMFVKQNSLRIRKIYGCMLFLILLFVYGSRGVSVGWDNYNYKTTFDTQDFLNWGYFHYHMEAGYLIFNRIVYLLTHNYICLQFASGLLILSCYMKFMSSFAEDNGTAVFMWLTLGAYFNAMNQVRQNMAVSAGIAAYMCLKKEKKVLAVLLLAAGFFFHKGIVVYIPFFIILYMSRRKVRKAELYAAFLFLTGCIFVIFGSLFRKLLEFVPLARSYLSRFAELGYLRTGHYSYPLFFTFLLVIGLYVYRICDIETKRKNIPFLMGTVMAAFFAYLSVPVNVMQRCMTFFAPFQIVFVTNMLSYEKMRADSRKILKLVVCICMFIFCYYYLAAAENGYGRDAVVPYVFFWQEA